MRCYIKSAHSRQTTSVNTAVLPQTGTSMSYHGSVPFARFNERR
jgi:hypothetical protein